MPTTAKSVHSTPEIDAWRALSPIGQWLAVQPRSKGAGRMADALGVTRSCVYKYACGGALPRRKKMGKILAMIRCSEKRYLAWYDSNPATRD